MLPSLVCSRGYKRAREGEGPKSLMEGSNGVESFSHFRSALRGASYFPFIDEGEGAGYMRERESIKAREKKASGVAVPFISFTRVLPVLWMMTGMAPRRDPVHRWRYTWVSSGGRGAPFRPGGWHV